MNNITTLYIVALSTIAVLSTFGQLWVQLELQRQTSDSLVVNIAGRLSGHNQAANNLTNDAIDPISKEPEFKACAISVTPVWVANWHEFAMSSVTDKQLKN